MVELNLSATKTEEIIIKDYLENNVSDTLADKINNGVKIEKDGKTLINKKTLATFMDYACEEARKQADKGARFACIGNDTVFSWATHYFEEDSMEGTLYNEDGTEYKPVTPVKAAPTAPKPQLMSLFDIVDNQTAENPQTEKKETTEAEDDDVLDMRMSNDIPKPTVQSTPEPTPNTVQEPTKIPSFIIDLFGGELKIEVDK
jgi:hypothetical protein